jgi:hypothetical protein
VRASSFSSHLSIRSEADAYAEGALKTIGGRWKLLIVFHLFAAGSVLRFSALRRVIPAVSQEMLNQQLRARSKRFNLTPPTVDRAMLLAVDENPQFLAIGIEPGDLYSRTTPSKSEAA